MTPAGEARVIELLEAILVAVQRQHPAPPSNLMDAAEVAAELGVNVRTLRRMRHEGQAPEPIKIGNALRWRRADVDRFLRARTA